MTVPAPSPPEPPERRLAPRRAHLGLLGLLAVLLAALAGLLVAPAVSAAPLVGAGNAVALQTVPAGQRVGAHEPKLPGQGRARAPNYDQTAVGSGVGAEEAGGVAGDHIVLGLRNFGLEETAAKVGGRTLLNDPGWMSTLQEGIADPSMKFTVSLDGMSGSGTYSQIMSAAQRGAAGAGGYTDWEMAQLYQGGRLPGVTFVSGGEGVDNPFGP